MLGEARKTGSMESGNTGHRLGTFMNIDLTLLFSLNKILPSFYDFEICLFSRIESPPLPSGDHEHPKVGSKGINVKLAVSASTSDKQAWPALVVKSSWRGLFQVVVSENQGYSELF